MGGGDAIGLVLALGGGGMSFLGWGLCKVAGDADDRAGLGDVVDFPARLRLVQDGVDEMGQVADVLWLPERSA